MAVSQAALVHMHVCVCVCVIAPTFVPGLVADCHVPKDKILTMRVCVCNVHFLGQT